MIPFLLNSKPSCIKLVSIPRSRTPSCSETNSIHKEGQGETLLPPYTHTRDCVLS